MVERVLGGVAHRCFVEEDGRRRHSATAHETARRVIGGEQGNRSGREYRGLPGGLQRLRRVVDADEDTIEDGPGENRLDEVLLCGCSHGSS